MAGKHKNITVMVIFDPKSGIIEKLARLYDILLYVPDPKIKARELQVASVKHLDPEEK